MAVLGVDVARYQTDHIDWSGLSSHIFDGNQRVRFAICKATEAESGVDPTFGINAFGAAKAGLLVGSYHYFWASRDAMEQARHYYAVAGRKTQMPPALDFESLKGCSPSDATARAMVFVRETERLWAKPCIVYTYPSFWAQLGPIDTSEFGSRPLWIAHYGVKKPTIPDPWSKSGCTIHQFDGDGGMRLPQGIDCDFNQFMGNEQMLLAWVYGKSSAPKPSDVLPTVPETPDSIDHRPHEGDPNRRFGSSLPLRAGEAEYTIEVD